jgi:hypothetical protein
MDPRTPRVFLLSPARLTGQRANILMRPEAGFELARRLRSEGLSLGEIFSFMSGLYFRGKLAYANAFAVPPAGVAGSYIITSARGLVPSTAHTTLQDLELLAGTPIDPSDGFYFRTLQAGARQLLDQLGAGCEVVLLGSVATPKYLKPLVEIFGSGLVFPLEFIGRGDLSRGGLLLRAAEAKRELSYVPLGEVTRHGPRPARLSADGRRYRKERIANRKHSRPRPR